MITSTDKKRVILFIALAFAIAWITSLVIYLNGGLAQSPIIIPSLGLNLATILMATCIMFAPGIAHILTRLFTREGWKGMMLQPNLINRGKYWMAAWFLPGILTIAGAAAFFYIFPQFFDQDLSNLQNQIQSLAQQTGGTQAPTLSPWLIVILQAGQALLLAPILNALFTFGEEFGWRAYLLPKLLPLGNRKAILLSGVIWGVWHWPIILMGYNYGFDYPGAPWMGLLGMVWFTTMLGIIISWLTLRTQSVWPAVIAHGAINGIAAVGLLAVKGSPISWLGPTPVGLIGGIFLTILAINLLFVKGAFKPFSEESF
ncbi:MAG: CPBP family intramembrane metalloprotease [Anaerolineaceae bacterium]|nr:CPBP family intramembrane metalloprotease [Anaerolineaceae bacterium]